MTEEQLAEALTNLPFEPSRVAVYPDGLRLVAVVVSPAFVKLDEAERQRLVWNYLHQRFDVRELARIEFVFTNTPQEDAEIEDAAGA
jgi:acid stress-induced BolA-like protein IbaG/YrbA